MIKEYVSSFGYLSVIVMVLFFTLFWLLVFQALKLGRQKSEEFSRLPIETDLESTIDLKNRRNSNG